MLCRISFALFLPCWKNAIHRFSHLDSMTGMESNVAYIINLSRCHNFSIWKFCMKQLLQKEDLWKLVKPKETVECSLMNTTTNQEVGLGAPTIMVAQTTTSLTR